MTREVKHVDGSKPTIVAMVLIHGQVIADAQAESSKYAKVAAAKEAQHLLSGLPLPEFREKYRCECRPEDEGEEDGHAIEELHGTAI